MTTIAIFVLGVFVSGITFAASLLIGLSEAADPAQSRLEDLTDFERNLVQRDDQKPLKKLSPASTASDPPGESVL